MALAHLQDVCVVAEMRGGSLPGQICVIVAVTNMIITGRWEREKKRRVTEKRGRVLGLLHAANKVGHLDTSQQGHE